MSEAEAVRQFTWAAGQPTPLCPQLMNKDEVVFLIKMMLDEMMELMATVAEPDEYKKIMKDLIDKADNRTLDKFNMSQVELIAEQADALVDSNYYALNAMAKKGINVASIFKIVHQANMDKCDPTTGKFIKREDGKILKPEGWKPPDICSEIRRQIEKGSFSQKLE